MRWAVVRSRAAAFRAGGGTRIVNGQVIWFDCSKVQTPENGSGIHAGYPLSSRPQTTAARALQNKHPVNGRPTFRGGGTACLFYQGDQK